MYENDKDNEQGTRVKTVRKMGHNQESRSLSFVGTSLQLKYKNNGPVLLFQIIIRH